MMVFQSKIGKVFGLKRHLQITYIYLILKRSKRQGKTQTYNVLDTGLCFAALRHTRGFSEIYLFLHTVYDTFF